MKDVRYGTPSLLSSAAHDLGGEPVIAPPSHINNANSMITPYCTRKVKTKNYKNKYIQLRVVVNQ